MLKLKLLRIAAGRSQWDLSNAAGISQGQYSMIERGHIPPKPAERAALAAALGTSPDGLFRAAFRTSAAKRRAKQQTGTGAELSPA